VRGGESQNVVGGVMGEFGTKLKENLKKGTAKRDKETEGDLIKGGGDDVKGGGGGGGA